MNEVVYKQILANLQRELIDLERSLESTYVRRNELEARRAEVMLGITGIQKVLKDRKDESNDKKLIN